MSNYRLGRKSSAALCPNWNRVWRCIQLKPSHVAPASVAVFLICFTLFAQSQSVKAPKKIGSPALPNAYQLTDKVISGGQPNGEAAFKELRDLGVKTVIS